MMRILEASYTVKNSLHMRCIKVSQVCYFVANVINTHRTYIFIFIFFTRYNLYLYTVPVQIDSFNENENHRKFSQPSSLISNSWVTRRIIERFKLETPQFHIRATCSIYPFSQPIEENLELAKNLSDQLYKTKQNKLLQNLNCIIQFRKQTTNN